jgi:hypothetical protein
MDDEGGDAGGTVHSALQEEIVALMTATMIFQAVITNTSPIRIDLNVPTTLA